MKMIPQEEYKKIIQFLDNVEGWEDISKNTRKGLQEKFQLLFTLVDQQQKDIEFFQRKQKINKQITQELISLDDHRITEILTRTRISS